MNFILFQIWINDVVPHYVQYLKNKHKHYANQHGYPYHLFRTLHPRFKDYHQAWSRFGYMFDLLKNMKKVVYLDMDVEILMMNRRIEDIMFTCPKSDLYLSNDHKLSGCTDKSCFINTGFIIAKNTPWMRSVLYKMLSPPSECRDYKWNRQWEQSCLQYLLEKLNAFRFDLKHLKQKKQHEPLWNINHTLCIINEVQNVNILAPYSKVRRSHEFARHFLVDHEKFFNAFHFNETL